MVPGPWVAETSVPMDQGRYDDREASALGIKPGTRSSATTLRPSTRAEAMPSPLPGRVLLTPETEGQPCDVGQRKCGPATWWPRLVSATDLPPRQHLSTGGSCGPETSEVSESGTGWVAPMPCVGHFRVDLASLRTYLQAPNFGGAESRARAQRPVATLSFPPWAKIFLSLSRDQEAESKPYLRGGRKWPSQS